ncbi:energy transducer TonB [Phenylobacterium sp.]|uniref:energy transducer TonB n=1 Tax=Phenylobacterium sp. TaxID=1871053 RepID=UPI002736CF2B|nr:energy transducer TonB [Phenylobacterium sp.]MDP3854593.1 energy transducer TonB [Phenylobacterium sp.]
MTNPDWLVRPTPEVLQQVYPHLAQELGLAGRATVSCLVDTTGHLRHCLVVDQFPAGLGFGAAALKATETFRMTPKTVDSQPVDSGTVRIPLRFKLPDKASSVLPVQGKPKSAVVAALTPKLRAAVLAKLTADYAGTALALEITPQTDVDIETRVAARKALLSAIGKIAPSWSQAVAEHYASLATDEQMEATIAFRSSPEGIALDGGAEGLRQEFAAVFQAHFRNVAVAARTAFCVNERCRIGIPQPVSGVGIQSPEWLESPDEAARIAARPPLAQAFNIAGWANLNCIVSQAAAPSFCTSVAESPAGFGFGRAANHLSNSYRLHPNLMSAGAQGETISVLVEFPAASQELTAPKSSPPDPARLALARQFIARERIVENITASVAALDGEIGGMMADAADQAAASGALRGAFIRELPHLAEALAAAQARLFTEAQLKLALAHGADPSVHFTDGLYAEVDEIHAHYSGLVDAEARRLFCADRQCYPPATKP